MRTGHADVLIIGAGASGGVAAARLAAGGLRVVCLEQGEWPDPGDYRGAARDWELTARKQWSSSPNVRGRPSDYPVDEAHSDIKVVNFNGVGGGTVLFNAQWPRLRPKDFCSRSVDGVGDDWPFGYEDLLPYYERIDREVGVSGLGGNPMYPPGQDPPLPPLPLGAGGLRLARALDRHGWHWWPETNAILSAPYGGRHPCVQRAACGQGCGEGAKSSSDVTHWRTAVAEGARLVTGARVHSLETDRRGLVTGAEWSDADGTRRFQGADVVLVAANGIGTPRLLLHSACSAFPDGLANRSGLVGRRLMLHPLATVVGSFDEDLRSWQGQAGASIQSMEFYDTDPGRGFVRGARWSLTPTGGPLRASGAPGGVWGMAHHRHFRARFGRSAQWVILGEDLPDVDNRVELSSTAADASGVPAPKVTYRVSENSRKLLSWHAAKAAESLREAGAHTTEMTEVGRNGHFMGTARMGDDPATSVVDRWGMAHDVANLGILDGSVFVTAGAANPTATISALSLRSAEHLLGCRRDLPVPERATVVSFPTVPDGPPAGEGVGADPVRISPSPVALDDGERRRLAELADGLIPRVEPMPSASEVGVQETLVDEVLTARPDLGPDLQRAVADEGPVAAVLDDLRSRDPAAHATLTVVVAAAYYLSPEVRDAIGYHGQEALTVDPHRYPEYVEEGLLDRVLERCTEG